MLLSPANSGSRSSSPLSYEGDGYVDSLTKTPWKDVVFLRSQDRRKLSYMATQLLEPVYSHCDTFGINVGQALLRWACKQSRGTFEAAGIAKAVFDMMRSETVRRTSVFRNLSDAAIIRLDRDLNAAQPDGSGRLVTHVSAIKTEAGNMVESLALLSKKPEDRLSAVILTAALEKAADAYVRVFRASLKHDAQGLSKDQMHTIKASFDGLHSILSLIDKANLLKTSEPLQNQLKILLPFYERSFDQMVKKTAAPLSGVPADKRLLDYALLGSGVKIPEKRPIKSWEEFLTVMRGSVSAALSHISLKKGKGIALNYLPDDVKKLCKAIQNLEESGVQNNNARQNNRMDLQAIDVQFNPEKGATDLKVIYNYSVNEYSGCMTVRAVLFDNEVKSLALDGSIFNSGRSAKDLSRLEALRRFINEVSEGQSGSVPGTHDTLGFTENQKVKRFLWDAHYKWNVPCSGGDGESMDQIRTNLQALWNCLGLEQP